MGRTEVSERARAHPDRADAIASRIPVQRHCVETRPGARLLPRAKREATSDEAAFESTAVAVFALRSGPVPKSTRKVRVRPAASLQHCAGPCASPSLEERAVATRPSGGGQLGIPHVADPQVSCPRPCRARVKRLTRRAMVFSPSSTPIIV